MWILFYNGNAALRNVCSNCGHHLVEIRNTSCSCWSKNLGSPTWETLQESGIPHPSKNMLNTSSRSRLPNRKFTWIGCKSMRFSPTWSSSRSSRSIKNPACKIFFMINPLEDWKHPLEDLSAWKSDKTLRKSCILSDQKNDQATVYLLIKYMKLLLINTL
jgi:hypothetical protein